MEIKKILSILAILVSSLILTSCAKKPAIVTPPAVETVHTIPEKKTIFRRDVYHKVAPGETIWRISKTYDVSAKSILEANNIKNSTDIEAGRILLIPQAYPRQTVIPLFPTDRWKYIIIHHSATDSGSSLLFNKIHLKRGWNRGIGYNFVIDNGTRYKKDGQIEVTPRWIKQIDGAHTKAAGMNKKGIGICLVGDFTNTTPTQKQMNSLVRLVNILRKYYHIPMKNILGHGEVPGAATKCPGRMFPWGEFRSRLRREEYKNIEQCKGPLQVIYVRK